MISFSKVPPDSPPSYFARDFSVADTNDLDELACAIASCVWSPIIWQDGIRHQTKFVSASFLALDFDTPEMSLDEALKTFCDSRHIIGTTKNHRKNKHGEICDRFRVVIPFDKKITDLDHYRQVMAVTMERYPVDKACKDGARFFFPCQDIVSVVKDGYNEEVAEFRPHVRDPVIAKVRPTKWAVALFKRKYQPTNRNLAVFGLAADLARLGHNYDTALRAVLHVIQECSVEMLPMKEIERTVRSAIDRK